LAKRRKRRSGGRADGKRAAGGAGRPRRSAAGGRRDTPSGSPGPVASSSARPPLPAAERRAASGSRARLLADGPVVLALALLAAYQNWILWSHFNGYGFAWTDLGIISDWFSNALYHARPFWVTDVAFNHLVTHFTPTIIGLTPFFLLSQSQYLLVLLGTLAMAVGLFLGHRFLVRLGEKVGTPAPAVTLLSVILAVFLSLNPFVKTVLGSAHIEVFYVPLALGLFYVLVFTERSTAAWVLFALALGVREESGLYLSLQCVALWFLPPELFADRRRALRRATLFAALALVYVVVIVKVVSPLVFDVHENHVHRGWQRWGDSWGEVVFHWLTRPVQLGEAIRASACLRLNRSFLFLPWLHPLYGIAVNLPGVLLFSADSYDKQMLWFYNASFLLPGFMVGFYTGIYRLARLARRLGIPAPARRRWLYGGLVLGGALVLMVPVRQRAMTVEGPAGFGYKWWPPAAVNARRIPELLRECPAGTRVATDSRRIVYLPNRIDRYLLRHTAKADIVLLFRDADTILANRPTAGEIWKSLEQDGAFALRQQGPDFRVYARPGVRCLGAR
jgi:hypothetical protein